MTKRRKNLGGEIAEGLTHNPFASLQRGSRESLVPQDGGATSGSPAPVEGARQGPAAHWLVRKERKGRGGKVVTIVSSLDGDERGDLGALARSLGQGLGTGARAKDGAIVVQGELSERVAEFLRATGARVTVGS